MNKAERLLNLLKILRSYRYPVSCERLAERLNVSTRTIYRDISTLQMMGAEIKGEAGVGYILRPTFFMPSLMFTKNEIESLILGMQWVAQFGDLDLSQSASDALNKIFDILPNNIKKNINSFTLRVGPPPSDAMRQEDLSALRTTIEQQRKVEIIYRTEEGIDEQQIIWPFTIGYFTHGRILVAWGETQNSYHHFKTSKIIAWRMLDETYPGLKDRLFKEWQALQLRKIAPKIAE